MRFFLVSLMILVHGRGLPWPRSRLVMLTSALLKPRMASRLAALEKMKVSRQQKLDDDQKKLRELQKSLEQQKAFMKEDVRKQKEQNSSGKGAKMTFAKLQKELAAEEAKLTRGIIQRMGGILADIGKRDNYTMILEKSESRILWAQQSQTSPTSSSACTTKVPTRVPLLARVQRPQRRSKACLTSSQPKLCAPSLTVNWGRWTHKRPWRVYVGTCNRHQAAWYGQRRCKWALEETAAGLIICPPHLADDIPAGQAHLICADDRASWGALLRLYYPGAHCCTTGNWGSSIGVVRLERTHRLNGPHWPLCVHRSQRLHRCTSFCPRWSAYRKRCTHRRRMHDNAQRCDSRRRDN